MLHSTCRQADNAVMLSLRPSLPVSVPVEGIIALVGRRALALQEADVVFANGMGSIAVVLCQARWRSRACIIDLIRP